MLDSTPATKGEQRLFTSPATPDQYQQNDRYADSVYSATPANSSVTDCTPGGSDRALTSPVPCDLGTHYEEVDMRQRSHEEDTDYNSLQHSLKEALLEKEAAIVETQALKKGMRQLQEESRDHMELFHRCLASERELCACAVQQANDAAGMLRDANIQLSAEVDLLRAHVEQLELESRAVIDQQQAAQLNEEGNEQLIAVLQVEIADLERKLQRAHRGRTASAEAEAAAMQRADILAQQVEQMAGLMEAEREENIRLKAALQAAGLLP